jgi:hypothetical protein
LDSHLGAAFVEGEGLAALLGRRTNLKLVCLNGCSTRPRRVNQDGTIITVAGSGKGDRDHRERSAPRDVRFFSPTRVAEGPDVSL